ncbi:MAG TPA: hypothetical protein VF571_12500 [Pyrinomonadaceae bacterium]|jgi:hypothetical protein
MDFTAIAAATVGALVPYLVKGGEKLTEKVVEEGFEQRSQIWESVKSLFIGDDLITLGLMEKYPDNQDMKNEVAIRLADRLKENPDVARHLEELLKQIPASQVKQNTMTQIGNDNIGLQDISGSDIKINQK